MANSLADRNLLFGILAVQMDFISRDQLIAGMNAWVLAKEKPLARVLQDQNALTSERHVLLEALVTEHLKQHNNAPEKSLDALSSITGSLPRELGLIADPDVQESILHLPRSDPFTTVSHTARSWTGAGPRFRIVRPHAKGGLGEVFVAQDEELHREVALKEIQDRHAHDPSSRARFLLEAEITGGLEHPGIVPVYGLGQYADGRPFYAMRFIRGDSLKDAIERFHKGEPGASVTGECSLDFRKLLGRFIDVCQAMQYAHDRGVLHRDLKPGNIMLGKYGETLVVDWGLAKAVGKHGETGASATRISDEPTLRPTSASGSAETVAGTALGTPAYMSPEQAAGRLDLLGPASDIYSLGATLYCLLTGKPPIDANVVAEVLKKVGTGDFPKPRQRKPDVDPALEAICLKAMALEPTQRYRSPLALANDIEHWLADEPVGARPEPVTIKVRRWLGKNRTKVTGAVVAAIVGVIALTTQIYLSQVEQNRRAMELSLRREYLNKEVNAALDEATESRKKLHGKLLDYRKVHELLSDIDEWQALVHEVKAPLDRARALAKGELHLLNKESLAGLLNLEMSADSDDRDLAFAKELDEIRFDHGRAAERYRSTFIKWNWIVEGRDPEEIAKSLANSPVRYAILAALELWATETKDRKLQQRLLDALRKADPNPWRDRFRDVEAWSDPNRLEQLAKDLVPAEQSPQIILALAGRLNGLRMPMPNKPLPPEIKKPLPPEIKKPKGATTTPVSKENGTNVLASVATQEHTQSSTSILMASDSLGSSMLGNIIPPDGVLLFAQGEQPKSLESPPTPVTPTDETGPPSKTLSGFGINPNKTIGGFTPPSDAPLPRRELRLVAKLLTQALLYYPRDFWLLCGLANTARDAEEEASCLRAALAIRPRSSAAHTNLGNAHRALGRLDPAIRHYQKAIELDPDDAIPHQNLAVALLESGKDANESVKHLRVALRLDSNLTKAVDLLEKLNRREITPDAQARKYRYEVAGNIEAPTTMEEEGWLKDILESLERDIASEKANADYQAWYRAATPASRKLEFVRVSSLMTAAEEKQLQEHLDKYGQMLDPLTKNETRLQGNLTDTNTDVVHEVKLTAGKPVVIAMRSRQFNTLLRLLDGKGEILAENDDIDSANKNSRIVFVPRSDGTYRIIATSFQRNGRGEYEIMIRQYSTIKFKSS